MPNTDVDVPTDPVLDALWARAVEAWDDDRAHSALLEHALATEQLPALAGRYRALKDNPERAERAQKKLDALVLAATQLMLATKTPPRTKTPWPLTAMSVAMFVIVSTWLAFKLFLARR